MTQAVMDREPQPPRPESLHGEGQQPTPKVEFSPITESGLTREQVGRTVGEVHARAANRDVPIASVAEAAAQISNASACISG